MLLWIIFTDKLTTYWETAPCITNGNLLWTCLHVAFQTNLGVFIRLLKVSEYINRGHNFACKKSKFHLQFIFLVSHFVKFTVSTRGYSSLMIHQKLILLMSHPHFIISIQQRYAKYAGDKLTFKLYQTLSTQNIEVKTTYYMHSRSFKREKIAHRTFAFPELIKL